MRTGIGFLAARVEMEVEGLAGRAPKRLVCATFSAMSTLIEIETAADSLSSEEKEELLRFLAMRLRKDRAMPKPRIYSDEELAPMPAEDQRSGERAKGKASEWLRTAKGSVHAAAGELADDARMAYYAAKYGLTR